MVGYYEDIPIYHENQAEHAFSDLVMCDYDRIEDE